MIHLCYFCDRNYWFQVLVSAASAASHLAQDDAMTVHLVYDGLDDACLAQMADTLRGIHPHVHLNPFPKTPSDYLQFREYHCSRMVYLRLETAQIFPSLDWMLMVDGDTLWMKSPAELWALRDEAYAIIGSRDQPNCPHLRIQRWFKPRGLSLDYENYFCAGLFLFHLKRFREAHLDIQARKFLDKYGNPPNQEQDILNFVCTNHALLPPQWGTFARRGNLKKLHWDELGCVHFVWDLPWKPRRRRFVSDLVDLWWKTARRLISFPPPFKAIDRSIQYPIMRLLFKIWKHSRLLQSIPYLRNMLGTEWPLP